MCTCSMATVCLTVKITRFLFAGCVTNMILSFAQFFLLLREYLKYRNGEESNGRSAFCLSEALLQLWKINSVVEFVEYVRAILSQLFPQCNYIHCFYFNEDATLEDFYSEKRIITDIVGNKCYEVGSNFTEATVSSLDGLVLNSYATPNEKVYVVYIKSNGRTNNLLFMVCGGESVTDTSQVDTFVHHATACFSRIYESCSSEDNADNSTTDFQLPVLDDIDHSSNASSMQIILNKYLSEKTASEQCCILFVSRDIGQIVCQIVADRILHFQVCHPMDGGGLFSVACHDLLPKYIYNPSQKEKHELKSLFCEDVTSALCVPIRDKSSAETICVVCLCNKSSNQRYSAMDVAIVNSVMMKSLTILACSLTLQKERKARSECEAMLQIARNLFTHLDDVGMLLGEIIQEARNLTNAERCSVFLVDKEANELVAKVFDGIVTMDESLDPRQYDFENMNEVRIPLTQGIAGRVASTGKTLNIADAYSHPLFYRGIDDTTGFRTRNILCFPIKDHNGVVVGVSQLCNKIKGPCFTSYDEELAEKFAVFSGISISHSLLYKEVEETGSRSQLANELVTYHMKVDKSDVDGNIPVGQITIKQIHLDFDKFIYQPRLLSNDLKVKACICMYEDLGLISRFHISRRTLVHFILMVRKGYRDPPYHNWNHAFSVMHHAYLLAKNLKLNNKLSDLEVIALLTACVCHDLDHRGTNNAFQMDSQSVLASLYSSEGSVMERHHFAQAVCILSTAGCNIFENMKRKDYTKTLDLMKYIILATDVASHLKILPQLEDMAKQGLNLTDTNHRKLLLALSMTACDLSDQTKNWKTTKNTSKLIYKEFFSQGDLEKRMGNLPALINDRERACVPELQINFMEHIALPVYRLLSTLFDEYDEVYCRVKQNVARWRLVEKEFLSRGLPNTDSLDFLTDEFDRDLFKDLNDEI